MPEDFQEIGSGRVKTKGKVLGFGSGAVGLGVLLWAAFHLDELLLKSRFTDQQRGYPFRYPSSWRAAGGTLPLMHYRVTFLSLNSMGREGFWVGESQTAPGTFQYSSRTVADQLPRGSVYLDIGWLEGPPGLPPGRGVDDEDLTRLLKGAKKEPADERGLVRRILEFPKDGQRWSIFLYLREPVGWMDRLLLERVLLSFRFTRPDR